MSVMGEPFQTYKNHGDDFFYAQQTSLWIFYKVPKKAIQDQVGKVLEHLGFELASFEDKEVGYIILKPMVFMAEFGKKPDKQPGTSASTEVELTVLVQPNGSAPQTPATFEAFLRGSVKQPTVGQLRLDVLCDNEFAVAAGRTVFGEHKYLGSFTYCYSTPNSNIGKSSAFRLAMTAYTGDGVGQATRMMFHVHANLEGLKDTQSNFAPELLFSAFPPEPGEGVVQEAVYQRRYYDNQHFKAFAITPDDKNYVEISYGGALEVEAEPLAPVKPYGDGKEIPGSEKWPTDMVKKMKGTLVQGSVAGFLLFQSPPAEFEPIPFKLSELPLK